MILTTFTYISFWANYLEKEKALEAEFSYFCKSQENVDLVAFLTDFLSKKPLLGAVKIDKIAIFHTLLYDNQCNTEFSPQIMRLIHEIGATFCISADRIKVRKKILEKS
jgi:hypothetical protein